MRLTALIGTIGLTCALASPAHAQQWLDDFDAYLPGPLAAQSLWEEWTGSTGVDADVTSAYSFTSGRSLKLVANIKVALGRKPPCIQQQVPGNRNSHDRAANIDVGEVERLAVKGNETLRPDLPDVVPEVGQ